MKAAVWVALLAGLAGMDSRWLSNAWEQRRLEDVGKQVGWLMLCVLAGCVSGTLGRRVATRMAAGTRHSLHSAHSLLPWPFLAPPQLASNARRLYGLNLCRGLGDKFLKDEDLGAI